MRILLLMDCYLPSTKSVATMMHDLAMEYCSQGHEVVILTPSSNIHEPIEISQEDKLTVVRVRSGKIKDVHNFIRAINERSLSSRLWRKAKPYLISHPCDLIIYYSPSIFFGKLVAKLKKIWRVPAYLVLRDIFPQWVLDAKIIKKDLVYRYFHRKEKQSYRAADVIGVQSPANLEYFRDKPWAKNYKLEVLYNWFDPKNIKAEKTHYRRELGLEDKFIFVYGGNIGSAQGIDNLLKFCEGMKDELRAHIIIVGNGSEFNRVKKHIQVAKLTNTTLMNAITQEKFNGLLLESNVGIITLDRGLTTHNVPGKFMSYLQAGLPVLASVNPGNDLEDLIVKYNVGKASIAEDFAAFISNGKTLSSDAEQYTKNIRTLLEQVFSVKIAASKILKAINECLNKKDLDAQCVD